MTNPMTKPKRKPVAVAAPTHTPPAADPAAAPLECPTCKADRPERLRTDRRAGFTFTRFQCRECGRVFIERDPPFPRRPRPAA